MALEVAQTLVAPPDRARTVMAVVMTTRRCDVKADGESIWLAGMHMGLGAGRHRTAGSRQDDASRRIGDLCSGGWRWLLLRGMQRG
jgi:hypothetical protein